MAVNQPGDNSEGDRPAPKKIPLVPLYVRFISLVGLLILIYSVLNLPVDKVGLLLFVTLSAIAEFSSVELFRSSRNSRVSASMIVSIAGVMIFGAAGAALVHGISGAMSVVPDMLNEHKTTGIKKASWLSRLVFNAAMLAISAFLAGWVYALSGGKIGNVSQFSNLMPLLIAVTVDVLANLGILMGVIRLQTGRPIIEIWRQDFEWSVPINIIGALIGSSALAFAYQNTGILGLFAFFVPVLMIGYSFRVYVSHTKEYVDKLEEMNLSLDRANLGLFETLGAVVDAYDEFTFQHSYQVAKYGSAIAQVMGLPKNEQADIRRAALIHDIGKIGILDSIISKPSSLSEEEYTQIKRHPIIGTNIIRSMEGLQSLIPLVRHHHERWDGTGYPAGLAGEEIPLGARIITLADAVEAMSSPRPYRDPKSVKEVMQEINDKAGKQFDPKVVEAFCALIAEKGENFIESSASKVEKISVNERVNSIRQEVRFLKKSMADEKK